MIELEAEETGRGGALLDKAATALIGLVAVMAAVLAILQVGNSLAGTRAQVQAARLSADASARISASSLARDASLRAQQDAVVLGMAAVNRMLVATTAGDAGALAVGTAQQAASDRLRAAVVETAATTGGAPVDAYASGLVGATIDGIVAEVKEQNRQVDLAAAASSREQRAVLGLSLLTLAGVLAGIAAVIGRGRAAWLTLALGWGMAAAATVTAILTAT